MTVFEGPGFWGLVAAMGVGFATVMAAGDCCVVAWGGDGLREAF